MHAPPLDLSAPHTASVIFTVVCVAIFAGATVWALRRAFAGEPLGLYMIIGGLLATFIEPILDNLGLLWFATDNAAVVFDAFSRSIPLYVLLGYGFFFGAEAYVAYVMLLKGKGPRFLWGLYVFAWFFDLALESTGHLTGLYKYYGPQPFNVWGVPLWWMFVNPVLPIVAGGVFYALRSQLHGLRALIVVPLLPLCYGAVYLGTAWPIFLALNSNVADAVIWLAAVATMGLCLLLTHLAIRGIAWLQAIGDEGESLYLSPTGADQTPRELASLIGETA